MRRFLPLLVVLALAAPPTAFAALSATKLTGTTGPGFTITLKKAGKKVTSLKAGKYTIVVQDKSNIHDFHLKGPGVNKLTSVSYVGNKTWTVTLKKGTYTQVCEPHR